MKFKLLFFIILSVIFTYQSNGQGCSDAGFCTMGAMRPNQPDVKASNVKLRSVELSHYTGYTKFADYINAVTADMNFSIGKKYGAQVKMPYFYVNGPLGKSNGLGDISLSVTRNIISKLNYQVNFSVGTKIPSNNSNLKSNDARPLPMYYQSSLGTYDFIFGASLITSKWLFATGFQEALTANKNEFVWGKWSSSTIKSEAGKYPKARNLRRGADIMVRAERNLRFSRLNAYLGALAIYRITPDVIDDPTFGNNYTVPKTTGLALTLLTGIGYKFSVQSGIKLMYGKQLITRSTNPDGLSREWVFTIGYETRF